MTGRGRRSAVAGRRAGAAMTIWLIIVWMLAVGCAPTTSDLPELTAEDVQALQDEYARTSFQAMRTRDQDLIAEVEDGPLLQRDVATMELQDRLQAPERAEEFTYPDSVGYPVSSRSGHDRQLLLTVSEYSNADPGWRNLGLYSRSGPAAEWMRTFTGGMLAADVPELSSGEPLLPLAPDAADFVATPNSMPATVANMLQDPDSEAAKLFAASQVRQRYADDLATRNRQVSDIGTVSREYQPGNFLLAVQVPEGYLMLGSFSFTETVTARAGEQVSFGRTTREHQLYPGHYDSTTRTFGAMFAAVVPPEGKITLICGEERQTGLDVE